MVIVVDFQCLFIPLGQRLQYIVSVENLLQKGDSDGLLKIVQSSRGVFNYSRISEEDFEFGNVVFNGHIALSHLDDLVKCISFLVIRLETVS